MQQGYLGKAMRLLKLARPSQQQFPSCSLSGAPDDAIRCSVDDGDSAIAADDTLREPNKTEILLLRLERQHTWHKYG
jgi:hypothetical protein